MKRLWFTIAVLAGALVAHGGAVRSLVRTGSFKEGEVDVRWEVAYPVGIEGWSIADLKALWKTIDRYVFPPESITHEDSPCTPAQTLTWVAEKLMSNKEATGATERALTIATTVKVPFADKEWVGLDIEDYMNEGGNGCHASGRLVLLSRETQRAMEPAWFAKDEEALRKLVVRHLEQALILKDKEGKSPFAGDLYTKDKAEDYEPYFLPVPEGLRFRYHAYEILPGCFGLPEVTVPWEALAPVCKAERLARLKALVAP